MIIYKSRKKIEGCVVSHLGETYLKNKSKGPDTKKFIKIKFNFMKTKKKIFKCFIRHVLFNITSWS